MNSFQVYEQAAVDQLEGGVKYVRIGEIFRFCASEFGGLQHCDLVKSGEKATSAGVLVITPKCLRLQSDYSMTLQIGSASDDRERLSKLFGRPFQELILT